MGYPNYLDPRPDATKMANRLSRMSQWIDDHPANRKRSPLENLMLRTSVKMHEERGEVNAALIGMSGQNPRKGVTHSIDDVESELLDWAIVALGGVEHIHGNDGSSMARLAAKLVKIHDRMEAKRTEAARLTLDEFKTAEPMVDLNAETERMRASLNPEDRVRYEKLRAASSVNWPEFERRNDINRPLYYGMNAPTGVKGCPVSFYNSADTSLTHCSFPEGHSPIGVPPTPGSAHKTMWDHGNEKARAWWNNDNRRLVIDHDGPSSGVDFTLTQHMGEAQATRVQDFFDKFATEAGQAVKDNPEIYNSDGTARDGSSQDDVQTEPHMGTGND